MYLKIKHILVTLSWLQKKKQTKPKCTLANIEDDRILLRLKSVDLKKKVSCFVLDFSGWNLNLFLQSLFLKNNWVPAWSLAQARCICNNHWEGHAEKSFSGLYVSIWNIWNICFIKWGVNKESNSETHCGCVCVSLVLRRKSPRCHGVLWQSYCYSLRAHDSWEGWGSYLENSVCGGGVGGVADASHFPGDSDVTQAFSAQEGDPCIWGTKYVWGCRIESERLEQGTVRPPWLLSW